MRVRGGNEDFDDDDGVGVGLGDCAFDCGGQRLTPHGKAILSLTLPWLGCDGGGDAPLVAMAFAVAAACVLRRRCYCCRRCATVVRGRVSS